MTRGRRTPKILWTRTARRDLEVIVDFLARQASPAVALRTLETIERRAEALRAMPLQGRVVPELARFHVRSYRELQAPPYRLLYKVADERVWLLAVLDGRRDLEDLLLQRLVDEPD